MARERDRLSYGLQDHAVSLVRFSPIHRISKFLSYLLSRKIIMVKKYLRCGLVGEKSYLL